MAFLLNDVLDYGRETIELVGERSADDIRAERMREHAVLRTIQVVGEAAAQALKLDPDCARVPGLREAISLRNILVHGYTKVRMTEIVRIVRHDLPKLLAAVEAILGKDT